MTLEEKLIIYLAEPKRESSARSHQAGNIKEVICVVVWIRTGVNTREEILQNSRSCVKGPGSCTQNVHPAILICYSAVITKIWRAEDWSCI